MFPIWVCKCSHYPAYLITVLADALRVAKASYLFYILFIHYVAFLITVLADL